MAWLNIDLPLETCTYHGGQGCPYVFEKSETNLKGLEDIKRDGGWKEFPNYLAAWRFHNENFGRFKFINHCNKP